MPKQIELDDMHLTFREEGQFVNAYVERGGSDPFIELAGSANAGMCKEDPDFHRMFRSVMEVGVSRMFERRSGEPVHLVPGRSTPVGGRA